MVKQAVKLVIYPMENLELKLLEEVNKLQRFAIKTPLDSQKFWRDWQNIFTTVRLSQIAIKNLLEKENISQDKMQYLKSKLQTLKDIENYLRDLKEIALQIKGYSIFSIEENEEENDDLDDFLF